MPSVTTFALSIWLLKFVLALLAAASARRNSRVDGDWLNRVQILVLGDLGRSPRMQYHALSAANNGAYVELVGYHQSRLHPSVLQHGRITIVSLAAPPDFVNTKKAGLFLLLGPLKVLFQLWTLWKALCYKATPSRWMIVQNPPSIPTLAVATLICQLRPTRLVVDWHNFGYSILALRLGNAHVLVIIARYYEWILGRFAFAHLCVTNSMARVLQANLGSHAKVLTLPDRPASIFQPLARTQQLAFLDRLEYLLGSSDANIGLLMSHVSRRRLGYETSSTLIRELKQRRAKLVVSATSWTPDEDFTVLLDALVAYDQSLGNDEDVEPCRIVVFVTGKGPGKSAFEQKVRELQKTGSLVHVIVLTGYLEDLKDYANLLASADLGISLHTSSSGLDLPMKVLDMFGAGLPVVGWSDFEAWPELVQEGQNGLGFRNAKELLECLQTLLRANPDKLLKLRAGATHEGKQRWDSQWIEVCGAFLELGDPGKGKCVKK